MLVKRMLSNKKRALTYVGQAHVAIISYYRLTLEIVILALLFLNTLCCFNSHIK